MLKLYIGGEERDIYITKKRRMRNLVLRIHDDGSLGVSCPFGVDEDQIKQFLYEKSDWIIKNEKKQEKKIDELQTGSNGEVTWLGKKYIAELHPSSKDKIFIYDDKFVFYLKDMSKKHIDEVFYNEAKKHIFKMISELRTALDEAICKENEKQYPYITIRYMKSRWGSCSPSRSHISISSRLIHYPEKCLEYVLLHEYSHLLVANHSKAFYDVVKRYMPDYRKYEKILNH